jgi:hypothetical protein
MDWYSFVLVMPHHLPRCITRPLLERIPWIISYLGFGVSFLWFQSKKLSQLQRVISFLALEVEVQYWIGSL